MQRLRRWPRITAIKHGVGWVMMSLPSQVPLLAHSRGLGTYFALLAVACLSACSPTPLPTPLDSAQSSSQPAHPTTSAGSNVHTANDAYVGSSTCGSCHADAYALWQGSHHQMAMSVVDGTDATFRGEQATFDTGVVRFSRDDSGYVITLDPDGAAPTDLRVRYAFGVHPLQQYLVAIGDGRMQALPFVRDTRPLGSEPYRTGVQGQAWYHLDHVSSASDSEANVTHWMRDGQNWNHMCADCHSTNVRKSYDAQSDRFTTQFSEISVGCEACHGPGQGHSHQPKRVTMPALDRQQKADVCASCHSRRTRLLEGFQPGDRYLDYFSPALLDADLYHADGQILDEVFVYGSFAQSKMHGAGVTCGNCHEPHSGQLLLPGNDMCTSCHSPAGNPQFPSLTKALYNDSTHHFHLPKAGMSAEESGVACVSCHMTGKPYMGVDFRRDHSFRVPRPDLSAATAAPDACTSCHQDRGAEWAAKAIADHKNSSRSEHFGPAFALARRAKKGAESQLVDIAGSFDMPAIVRGSALSLLAAYPQQLTALAKGAADADPLVRLGAVSGAQGLPPAQRWQILQQLLADPLRSIRFAATMALGDLYPQLATQQQRQLQKALLALLQALEVDADRAEALSLRALLHLHMGQTNTAEKHLLRALTLNPQWVPGLINLADIYRLQGRDQEAGVLLDRALALADDSANVVIAKALWLVRQGLLDKALVLLGSRFQQQPDARLTYIYAIALNSSGESARALEVIDQAVTQELTPGPWLQIGISLAQDRDDDLRRAQYQRYAQAASTVTN